MGCYVCNGATLMCTMGVAPSSLVVLPAKMVLTCNMPMATIMDNNFPVNIIPFGLCTSPACPTFIKISGTPGPCVPAIPAPWMPGSPKVMVGSEPALTDNSQLQCIYGGSISVLMPGVLTVQY